MPFVYRCKNCGGILLEEKTLPGACEDWYSDLFYRLHKHCPHCNRKLPNPSMLKNVIEVDVKPYQTVKEEQTT